MTKDVNIYKPAGSAVWYANFRAKVTDPIRGEWSKQFNISTKIVDRRLAQAVANKLRDEKWAEAAGLKPANKRPALRDNSPTIGEILEVYAGKLALDEATKARNRGALLAVISEGYGTTGNGSGAAQVRSSQLGESVMKRFREQEARSQSGLAHRRPQTINCMMRMAKSIFSKRAMEAYADAGLELPRLQIASFMGVSRLEVNRDALRYRAPAGALWEKMDAKIGLMLRLSRWHAAQGREAKANEWLNAYVTYKLMRKLGLRNDEAKELRWEWFNERADGKTWLELDEKFLPDGTLYWEPKGNSRSFSVKPELVKEIAELSGTRAGGPLAWVLKGTMTDRHRGSNHAIGKYVRRFIKGTTKSAYLLRKQFGSEMVRDHGIEVAHDLLGHADIATTRAHYADILKVGTLPALG